MPKILIIDDDREWCKKLGTPLTDEGLQVTSESNRSEATNLLRSKHFDLVVLNVCLTHEETDDKVIRQWIDLLELIKQQRAKVIIVTSQSFSPNIGLQGLTRTAFRDYKAVDFLTKEDFDSGVYHQDVLEGILDSQQTHIIGHREYKLHGVNLEIFHFLSIKGVLDRVFKCVNDYEDKLFMILGGNQYDEQLGVTKQILTDLWNVESGLVPYLFVKTLSEFEFDRQFYVGYRDHITHQLRVYLLGLYLYYGDPVLQDAINQEFSTAANPEMEFLRSWKVAAFFHDLGYVFEVEKDKKERTYSKVLDELNAFFELPLFVYCNESPDSRGKLLKPQERKIQAQLNLPRPQVDSHKEIEIYKDCKLLDIIEPLTRPATLSYQSDSLSKYYKYAQSANPVDSKRNAFIDHGITSSLLLLYMHSFFEEYTCLVSRAIQRNELRPKVVSVETSEILKNLSILVQGSRESVLHAAAAVALHNIQVDIWDHDDAWRSEELTLYEYKLSLNGTPLAFLLALVDALQDWDRPLFSPPSTEKSYISQDQDISVTFSDNRIKLQFLGDEYAGTPGSKFKKLVTELKKYMNGDDIDRLLIE